MADGTYDQGVALVSPSTASNGMYDRVAPSTATLPAARPSTELQQPPGFMPPQPRTHTDMAVGSKVTPARRGACAEVDPCGPTPPGGNKGSCVQPIGDSATGSPQRDLQQAHESVPPALDRSADALSQEAKSFLRDDLNAQLIQRGRELAEAAWQTLE